jgi:hypothetical protein
LRREHGMKRIFAVAAVGLFEALTALLAVPLSAADTVTTTTLMTSDQLDALGIPWDASLEDWSTALATTTPCTGPMQTGRCECPPGILPPGTYYDVTVPPGQECDVNSFNRIEHDLTVLDGASLLDGGSFGGAYIGHDVRARNPFFIVIETGTVGHDIHIQGTTGFYPVSGDNYICNQEVGHDVVVQKSAFTAVRWVIGDNGEPFYLGCGNSIAHDLVVKDNLSGVDISGNSTGHGATVIAGIGHDLKVAHNHGGTIVNDNSAGHDCTQSDNSPYVGAGNAAGNNNNCNT